MLRRPARFVNRTWPWLPLALLTLGLLRAAVSIAHEQPADDVTRINQTVHGYGKAAVAGRGQDACFRLTPRAQARVSAPVGGGISCSVALRSFGAPYSPGTLQYVRLRDIVIRGDRATIGSGDVLGGDGVPTDLRISLQQIDGRWRLDDVRPAPAARRRRAAAARP